uniref:Uncharacterized protein n=1 Tax=viral metagenome TaxID=1070528 RepID=A0A6H1ZHX7_9ZZZZ
MTYNREEHLKALAELYPELKTETDKTEIERLLQRVARDASFILPDESQHCLSFNIFFDALPLRIESAKEELLNRLQEEKEAYLAIEGNELDHAALVGILEAVSDEDLHAATDSAVPVYSREIDEIWFLHVNELEEAYENSGIGDNPRENNGMTAIYCYIEEALQEYASEWRQSQLDKLES